MKKVIAIVLLLTMALGLVACGGSGDGGNKAEGLQIGYAKINTTPKGLGLVGLGGYADHETRKNTDGLTDYIYATCIAAKEGDETILMFTLDLIAINEVRANEIRALITAELGIPGEKMFFGASHCHSAPADVEPYKSFLTEKIVEAAKAAVEDLAPATLSVATTQTEKMTFVRHYLREDGTYSGSNFGDSTAPIVDYAAKPDEQMIVVKFDRPEEKQDVVMVNFQSHNDRAKQIGYNMLSPSWVGVVRNTLEEKSGCLVAYFTGASGNLNPDSNITEDAHGLDWKEYGTKLGEIAYDTMSKLQPVSGTGISTSTYIMSAKVNHEWDSYVNQAKEVQNLRDTAGNDAANVLAKSYGFTSIYQANAIVSRTSMGESENLEQSAFRIHDLGFIVGSYEMFSTNAMAVKEASPYDVTFVITGNKNYIPSIAAFEYRSYEGDTCRFIPGTGEKLQDKFIELLKAVQ